MNEYLRIFYLYVLPLMALLSFGYIIYLLLARRRIYKKIEYDLKHVADQSAQLSKSAIVEHFKKMQGRTAEMLQHLNHDAQEQLEISTQQLHKLQELLQEILIQQIELNNQMSELERSNAKLHNEVKKRDAIIERKNKQIARLRSVNEI